MKIPEKWLKQKASWIYQEAFRSLGGAEGGTRTPTGYTHYPLKIACLPIPPLRQIYLAVASAYILPFVQSAEVELAGLPTSGAVRFSIASAGA